MHSCVLVCVSVPTGICTCVSFCLGLKEFLKEMPTFSRNIIGDLLSVEQILDLDMKCFLVKLKINRSF